MGNKEGFYVALNENRGQINRLGRMLIGYFPCNYGIL
ncbi:MAG: hypothetical protein ACJAUD_001918 [Crocinitomicaceae bacterium]|jgi:hypothetical protein